MHFCMYSRSNNKSEKLYMYYHGSEKVGFLLKFSLYPPQTVFVGGYTVFTLSESPTDRPTDRVSETFCFFNNFKNH